MPKQSYHTAQRQSIMRCLQAHGADFLTVDQIYQDLLKTQESIGRTTVYRQLEKLTSEGMVIKYAGMGRSSAHYRLAETPDLQTQQGRLYCTQCGEIFNIDCSMLESFADHVQAHHGFQINKESTLMYGLCSSCTSKKG